MASSYHQLMCTGCGASHFEYIPEKKVWRCKYCGNEIRREEEYDGLYSIKNVVKQVLTDLAYYRLDAAQKNLIECEKMNSDYAGTLIAEICLGIFRLLTPEGCPRGEVKSMIGRIRRLYQKLDSAGISMDEEALYESFGEEGDTFGVLVLVYDTLQAKAHLDFVLKFFDASLVYSRQLNEELLKYALKNGKTEMVDKIFANDDNIDCRNAFFVLLDNYADCENKRQYLQSIARKAEFLSDDGGLLEGYFEKTADSLETRVVAYVQAAACGIAPSMRIVAEHILNDPSISREQIADVYAAFCKTKPRDAELYDLISKILFEHTGVAANFELQQLLDNGIYIKLSDKAVAFMLNRAELSVDERIGLLQKTRQCNLNNRAYDAIVSAVLLGNGESPDVRMALVRELIGGEYIKTLSTNTVTEYILNGSLDGERKPEMLAILLTLDLNMSYYRDVLNQYMKSSADSPQVRTEIIRMLENEGLGVGGEMLVDMACSATDADYMEKVGFIAQAIQNGSRLQPGDLSRYLETVSPANYHGELISLLCTPSSQVSDAALANYVLFASEDFQVKLQNSLVFAEKNGKIFGESPCVIRHLNTEIRCNLFQAYVLCTEDSAVTAEAMVDMMNNAKARLNPMITVNGQAVKFKKYVVDRKASLSPVTLSLCESMGVFSFRF